MKHVIAVLMFLIMATAVQAEELSFEWTLYEDQADGFRIYMNSSDVIVANNIPVADTSITLTADLGGECKNFWMRAFRGDLESGNSDIAIGCPVNVDPPYPTQPPVGVDGFTIHVSVTPN